MVRVTGTRIPMDGCTTVGWHRWWSNDREVKENPVQSGRAYEFVLGSCLLNSILSYDECLYEMISNVTWDRVMEGFDCVNLIPYAFLSVIYARIRSPN